MNQTFLAAFKKFAKFVVLGQIASDAGKQMFQDTNHNCMRAYRYDYAVKNEYLAVAVKAAKNCSGLVKVSQGDGDGILYFDIKGYGQISFHTFQDWKDVPTTGKWKGNYGESRMVAMKLSKKLQLGIYNRYP